jgi:hypothetical protein
MTPLDKSLKRGLRIKGHDYVVTLGPEALKITQKGHRLGVELKWEDLISGESALAVALHASIGKFHDDIQPAARRPGELSKPKRARRAAGKRKHTAAKR